MRKILLFGTVLAMMASCTSEDFTGDQSLREANESNGVIVFESSTPRITRAESGATAATTLGKSFAVYATKTVGSDTYNVFALNPYSATSNTPYWVWYNASTAQTTTSNNYDWEYVGTSGALITDGVTTLSGNQTIKYWDFSADKYEFIAYKAKSGGTISDVNIGGFSFSGTATHFAGLYVADKLTITGKSNPAIPTTADNLIGDGVKFTFRSGAAKVRLGIFETIPGYNVRNVSFKPTSPATFTATDANALLSGSFNGNSKDATGDFSISYDTNNGIAIFSTTTAAQNYFNFGTFNTSSTNYLRESSTSPTWANGSSDYISVLPNQDHVSEMILCVDYELYNTITHETISITDAKAVVPSAYMKWNPNYAYTYLFKITDDKLTPITLDAIVIESEEGVQETITTVSEPSITTFGTKTVSGKTTYVTGKNDYETGTDIYATIYSGSSVVTPVLSGGSQNVKIYLVDYKSGATAQEKAEKPIDEESVANAIAHTGGLITATEVTTDGTTNFTSAPAAVTTVPGEDGTPKTIGAVKLTGVKTAGKYAIEYTYTESATVKKAYKVITVVAL